MKKDIHILNGNLLKTMNSWLNGECYSKLIYSAEKNIILHFLNTFWKYQSLII